MSLPLMNQRGNPSRRVLRDCLVLIALLLSLPCQADVATSREEYEIPDHGSLLLNVPRAWQAIFYQPANNGFPIISFFPYTGSENFSGDEVFQLSIAVFWTQSVLHDLTDPKNLRQFVESVGRNVLKQSDQDTLELKEFAGQSGTGYLFNLTDSDAGAGEYTHLTQGALAVGDVVVVFALLTRANHDALRAITLAMLKTAQQDANRRSVSADCDQERAMLLVGG